MTEISKHSFCTWKKQEQFSELSKQLIAASKRRHKFFPTQLTCNAKHNAPKRTPPIFSSLLEKIECVIRWQCINDAGVPVNYVVNSYSTYTQEPRYHDRSKKATNSVCSKMLKSKKAHQDYASNEHNVICMWSSQKKKLQEFIQGVKSNETTYEQEFFLTRTTK